MNFFGASMKLDHIGETLPNHVNNPKIPFSLIYPKMSGVFNWMMGDNEENLARNLLKAPLDWKYRNKTVTYTINAHGYRAPEWDQIDWKNSIVLFGCSCTYGVGVSDEETIHYHLEKLTGRPVINLGVPSGSNSLMIQNAVNLLEYFPIPYAVANIWSCTDRFRFFTGQSYIELGAWTNSSIPDKTIPDSLCNVYELWKQTFIDPIHEAVLAHYEGQIGKCLWQDKTKYTSLSFFPQTVKYTKADKFFTIDGLARDLIHPSENDFNQVAEYLAEKFK
jgi:hypothetical protein